MYGLERVQIKMVTAISGLNSDTHEERLVEIGMEHGMESLETEWLDRVQTYKIGKEVDNVDRTHWFTMRGEEGSRGTNTPRNGLARMKTIKLGAVRFTGA